MKRLKIYLDTSVISYLDQNDAPEKMSHTLAFWEFLKKGKCDILVSRVTLDEIEDNKEPKRSKLKNFLEEIDYTVIEISDEIRNVADKFIENGILTKKSYDDCVHIASSLVHDCTCIISWNFKHIVNMKMMNGVKLVAAQTGYGFATLICTPSYLMEGI